MAIFTKGFHKNQKIITHQSLSLVLKPLPSYLKQMSSTQLQQLFSYQLQAAISEYESG
jgi:hypothetical protein